MSINESNQNDTTKLKNISYAMSLTKKGVLTTLYTIRLRGDQIEVLNGYEHIEIHISSVYRRIARFLFY